MQQWVGTVILYGKTHAKNSYEIMKNLQELKGSCSTKQLRKFNLFSKKTEGIKLCKIYTVAGKIALVFKHSWTFLPSWAMEEDSFPH